MYKSLIYTHKYKFTLQLTLTRRHWSSTLVPEVFLDFSVRRFVALLCKEPLGPGYWSSDLRTKKLSITNAIRVTADTAVSDVYCLNAYTFALTKS